MANQPGINPPPPPSTPASAPWEQMASLITQLQELTSILKSQSGLGLVSVPGGQPPGATTILNLPKSFGAAGSTNQMISVMLESTAGALGEGAILPFQKTIATEYQDEQDRLISFNSIITAVLMSFPAGCQQLLETRLIYYGKDTPAQYIVPSVDASFIALDDATVIFTPETRLKAPGRLRVEWWNYDTLNTHSVPVIVTLKRTNLLSG